MKKVINVAIVSILITLLLNSCIDQKFDKPNIDCQNQLSITHTIKQLKALFVNDTVRIKDDIIIGGYVISDDKNGNFYKELYLQDATGGIVVMLDDSYLYTRYKQGQLVYIKCKDLYLGKDGSGTVKLGSLYTDNGIVKFGRIQGRSYIDAKIIPGCESKVIEPLKIKITQLHDTLLHRLVKIDSVQFADEEINKTYADATNKVSMSRYITDKKGNKMVLYNSGYASFANDSLPKGNGTIYAVLSQYGGTYQLLIRSTKDVKFTNPRINPFNQIIKDFEDQDIYSGGWFVKRIKGNKHWQLGTYSGKFYVECNNYANPRLETESWYISPLLDLTLLDAPYFEFNNACRYSGDFLKVYYTTDNYTDTTQNPNNFNWVQLNPILDNNTSSYIWTNSGKLFIPKETKRIAFKYIGTTTSGRHWEVDNIKILDNVNKK